MNVHVRNVILLAQPTKIHLFSLYAPPLISIHLFLFSACLQPDMQQSCGCKISNLCSYTGSNNAQHIPLHCSYCFVLTGPFVIEVAGTTKKYGRLQVGRDGHILMAWRQSPNSCQSQSATLQTHSWWLKIALLQLAALALWQHIPVPESSRNSFRHRIVQFSRHHQEVVS